MPLPTTLDKLITVKLNRVWDVIAPRFGEADQERKTEINILIYEAKYYANKLWDDKQEALNRNVRTEKQLCELEKKIESKDEEIKLLEAKIRRLEFELNPFDDEADDEDFVDDEPLGGLKKIDRCLEGIGDPGETKEDEFDLSGTDDFEEEEDFDFDDDEVDSTIDPLKIDEKKFDEIMKDQPKRGRKKKS